MSHSPSGSNSSSTTPPDTPAEPANTIQDDNRAKRFDFLLKQTEVFSHFMGGTKAKSPLKMKPVKEPKKKASKKEGDSR